VNERRTVHARVVFLGIFAVLGLVATTVVALVTGNDAIVATLAGLTGVAVGSLAGAPRAAGGLSDAEVLDRFTAAMSPPHPPPAPSVGDQLVSDLLSKGA
jgi:hypothetical protein